MSPPFPSYHASGSSRQLGREHGEQAAEQIRAFLDYLRASLKLSAAELRLRAMRFCPLFDAACPRLVEEIEGLAEGAAIHPAEALAVQIRGELGPMAGGACTTFAIGREGTERGQVLIGQTSDMAAEIEPLAYVLHLAPFDRPAVLFWTFGGMLGYHGLNSRGVAHFANSLGGGPAWRFALPHYPLKRLFLECGRTAEVVRLMRCHRVCSSGNYVVCDGDGTIADVELTPDGAYLLADEGSGFLVHSNHFLCAAHNCAENLAKSLPDSVPRLERIRSLVQSRFGSLTVEDLKAFLSDHDGYPVSICRHPHDGPDNAVLPRSGKTAAAIIAEPEAGRMHVARGNPCEQTFMTHSLEAA